MIIDNVEALKTWLTKTLSPICDADPAALAKYVVALVKKDKPENELNDNLIDQLDVFLQSRTRSFVSGLFEALKTKSYINSSSNGMSCVTVPPTSSAQGAGNNYQNSAVLNQNNHSSTSAPQPPPKSDRKRKVVDGSDAGPSEEDKDYRKKRSRSSSPKGGPRFNDDRRRRHDDRRFNRRRSRDRSRSKSPRGKSRERHRPPRDSARDRERSRSPAMRTFSGRSRSRSWSPQRSRSRSRSRGRKDVDSRGSTPLQDADNFNAVPVTSVAPVPPGCSSPVPPVSNAISVVAPWDSTRNPPPVPAAANPDAPPRTTAPSSSGSNRPRCRDYDEKGYCMRGDLCPYDHGLDPVIVEDVNLPNVLTFPHGPPTGPGGPGGPGFVGPRIPPPNHPHLPPMGPRGPPPRPSRPVESYPPEGYNPEAPAINPPRPHFWVGPRGPPRPNQPFYPQPPRQRDLVNVPTIPDVSKPPRLGDKQNDNGNCETNRTVIPPKRDYVPTNDLHKPQNQQQHHYQTRSQPHQNFQPNYQPGHGRTVPRHLNTTLEVRKVPRDQNNIAKLNEHFGKFGVLKNIQVSFENDLEAALITFANHSQANTAYRSSEPVFNNRFIKVFWHREKLPDPNNPQPNTSNSSNVTKTTSMPPQQTDHRMSAKARLGIPAPNLLSLDNTVPKKTETAEKAIVFTTSMGHLTKTVFNPAAMKSKVNNLTTTTTTTTSTSTPTTKTTPTDSTSFTKTDLTTSKKTIPKKDNTLLKKVQNQRHELLTRYLQQQKILIKKYEDKTSPPETKSKIKEQIDNLTTVIKKLQEEIYPKKSSELPKPKSTAVVTAAAVTTAPPTANSQKTQKEILDTELELISKQKSGEDTTDLRKKLIELTQEAAALGLLPRGRGTRGGLTRGAMRMRGGSSWSRGAGRGAGLKMMQSSRSLDNRPKQIHVSGFESNQYTNLIAHFSLFCEVVKSEPGATDNSAILTFKSRQDAEKAVTKCTRYKEKDLKIQWYTPGSTIATDSNILDLEETEVLPGSPSYLTDLDDSLLAADDEDEEDEESRSWRR